MATQITNQATLNYISDGTTVTTSSNTAVITLQGPLEITKYSLENAYQLGENLTYNLFVTNTSTNALTNVVIDDDLGTYATTTPTNVTPLTYIGPAKLFVDSIYSGPITGTVSASGDSVEFTILNLAAGSTALIQYVTRTNQFAPGVPGSSEIDNIATATATGVAAPVSASNTIPVASYADIIIEKSMSPDPVIDGMPLTYTFTIRNYGTDDATTVVLTDTFDPAPTITQVRVNGVPTTDYIYTGGLFTFPNPASATTFTVPKASITQDPATGIVTVDPTIITIVVTGTI